MKILNKEDEILIQQKIEGGLSPDDEKRFYKLIKTSSLARNFYRNLLTLNNALEADNKQIPEIDLSGEIMNAVKEKHRSKAQIITFPFRKNLLTYAAILTMGLVIGSLATYLSTHQEQSIDKQTVSGTIGARSVNNFNYSKEGTEIKLQEFNTDQIKLTTVAINTKDTIVCRILDNNYRITNNNINLLFSDGSFQPINNKNSELKYSCSGNIVFHIKRNSTLGSTGALSFQIIKNGVIFKQFEIN